MGFSPITALKAPRNRSNYFITSPILQRTELRSPHRSTSIHIDITRRFFLEIRKKGQQFFYFQTLYTCKLL